MEIKADTADESAPAAGVLENFAPYNPTRLFYVKDLNSLLHSGRKSMNGQRSLNRKPTAHLQMLQP